MCTKVNYRDSRWSTPCASSGIARHFAFPERRFGSTRAPHRRGECGRSLLLIGRPLRLADRWADPAMASPAAGAPKPQMSRPTLDREAADASCVASRADRHHRARAFVVDLKDRVQTPEGFHSAREALHATEEIACVGNCSMVSWK
jgi:hypothetical protein